MIRAIVAVDDVRGIGKAGLTPWHIPAELAYFKQKTFGDTVIMGAHLYELFEKPLVGRRNIVASTTLHEVRPGFELIQDARHFIANAAEDTWIIGGAALYASTLDMCDELYITHIQGNFECDRFFPPYEGAFTLVNQSAVIRSDQYSFTYGVYKRT